MNKNKNIKPRKKSYNQSINDILYPKDELPSYIKTPFDEVHHKKYMVFHDGSHYVARLRHKAIFSSHKSRFTTPLDRMFTYAFKLAMENNIKKDKIFTYIKNIVLSNFTAENTKELDNYLTARIKRQYLNMHKRKQRFIRKANLNRWNYFITFTYDDKKQTEESFRLKLKRCLSNLHTRRGWRIMGRFENAPDTKRLHFHCLAYIPDGQMIGEIKEIRDYSTAQRKMQKSYSNTFFADTFGRNDFKSISKVQRTVLYILKYIEKSDEKMFCSRGILDEIPMDIEDRDIACTYVDFFHHYVLFDDSIDFEMDIMHYKRKQVSMFDTNEILTAEDLGVA